MKAVRPRVGRLARWQRRCSLAVLTACAVSGLAWWTLTDGFDWDQPRLRICWIAHGISGSLALLALGAVLPQHVAAAWRHHRNRGPGAITLATLSLAAASALLLLYGPEAWRLTTRWLHLAAGVGALLVFPWHVLHGRRR